MKNFLRTSLAAAAALVATQAGAFAQQIYLNELYISHSGTDLYEFIELKTTPGRSLDNIVVLVVEGDWSASGNEGTLDRVWDLTGYTVPASGLFVLGSSGLQNSVAAPFTADFNFGTQDRLENGSDTFYVVDAGSSANVAALNAKLNQDVDPDNDGITDIPTLSTILDHCAVVDGGINQVAPNFPDRIYDGAIQLGPEGVGTTAFLPGGVFRGIGAPAPWCADFLDFNEAANALEPRTPGAQNSVCPSAVQIVNYCTSGTTTNGCNAVMGYTGLPSLALGAGGFTVNCTSIEGAKTGLIFYSISGRLDLQWGASSAFLCVKSPQQRTATVGTGGIAGACDGSISLDFFNYTSTINPIALGTPFAAGNQAWFQCWFRDPPSPKTTMLSDGLEVTFIP
ncbi:MAG: hypothetical protein FJ294_05370 [Planctomycetes bacterium]|nr:hypothetical protein [Planctomycetota bacterium]